MIDVLNITDYDRSAESLQEVLMLCVAVAGKSATTTAKALDRFLHNGHRLVYGVDYGSYSPFHMLKALKHRVDDYLPMMIRAAGMGCYNQRARTFVALADSGLDLKTCSTTDLEKIPGIGMKTSRFFILHSRRDAECVPIDTHAKKFLRDNGVIDGVDVSLSPKNYLKLERAYIDLWKGSGDNKTLAEFDLNVWRHYAGHNEKTTAELDFLPRY